jgi:hypothetical protein
VTTKYLSFESRHSRGGRALHQGGTPDTSGQQAAALMQAELSKEQLEWAKTIYAESAPARTEAAATARDISNAQLAATRQQTQIAADAYSDYTSTYRPLEQSIVADARGYDTTERRAAEASKASADVQTQIDAQRSASMREMQRAGVNPASGKVMALQGSMDLGAAKAKAGAANTATRQIETIGAARKADAANLGRNIASSQATNASLALQQGNSAVGNAGAVLSAQNNGTGGLQQGYAGAMSGLGSAAGTMGSIANQQAQAEASSNQTMAAVGSTAAMAAMMFMSDKTKKKDIKPVTDDEALQALDDTPVSRWKYKDGAVPGDQGKEHVGPMAQDVNRTMGERAAPKGKQVDIVALNGITMAAVKALNNKVDALAASVGAAVN